MKGDVEHVHEAAKLYWPNVAEAGILNAIKDSGASEENRRKAVEDFVDELHCIGDSEKAFPLRLLRGYLRKAADQNQTETRLPENYAL